MPLVLLILLGLGAWTVASVAAAPSIDANLPPRVRRAVDAALSTNDPGRRSPARLKAFSAALAANRYPLAAAAVAARASKG